MIPANLSEAYGDPHIWLRPRAARAELDKETDYGVICSP